MDLGRTLGVSVTAIAAGPAEANTATLTQALALGCTRAIRVETTLAEELDYLGLSQILAQAIRRAQAGWVVCCERSWDEAAGAIGAAIAELIDAAHLPGIESVAQKGSSIVVDRGAARFQVRPPAVLCMTGHDDRLLHDGSPDALVSRDIEVVSLRDLGLDAEILAHRRIMAGVIIEASPTGEPSAAPPDGTSEPP